MSRSATLITYSLIGFAVVISISQPASALRKRQPWHVTTEAEPDAQAGGRNNPSYADMGRTGASAIAHYLSPVGGAGYKDFAKLNAGCIGNHPKTFPDTHGSPLLGMVWTALGALPDPVMFRKLMDYNRWHFALAQCADGTFYYQPNRDNNPQDFAADPRLGASAVTALILSVKYRRLQMTGARLTTLRHDSRPPTGSHE